MKNYLTLYLSNLSERQRAWVLMGVSFLLGLAFYGCFWNQSSGLSTVVYTGLVIGASWLLLIGLQRVWPKELWLVAAASVYLAAMLSWRDSTLLAVINCLTLFGLALLAVWMLAGESWRMRLLNYIALIFLPLSGIKPFFKSVSQVISKGGPSEKNSAVATGILVTIPVVLILAALFIKTDAILNDWVSHLLLHINTESAMSWVVILAVTGWFVGAYSFIVQKAAPSIAEKDDRRILGVVESRILLGAVNAVFGLFLLLQFVYLFGGETYLAHNAVTYAEYARQGFVELVLAALIAAGVIWLSRPYVIVDPAKKLGGLGMLLAAQVLIVLASAMNRLWLYEQAYGFTLTRLVGQTLMIWLCLVFVVLLLQMRGKLTTVTTGPAMVGLMVLAVIGFNIVNPEAFIVQQNSNRYHQMGKIDLGYLDRLSNDAVPALLPLQKEAKPSMSQQMAINFNDRLSGLEAHPADGWQSWNWSRYRSKLLLEQYTNK
jgi:hypothetical protein